ncbi:MAG: hypothetical protein LBB28_02575 [Synergistaceae bacterium]|jgi:hypothetical protein|nr:hypothetical protein [Synergistaceae bacterium]
MRLKIKPGLFFLLAAALLAVASPAFAGEGPEYAPGISAYSLKDGSVYMGETKLDCEVFSVPAETGDIRYWSAFGTSASDAVPEAETGVRFFASDGTCLTFVPLDSEYEAQTVTFSPNGKRFVLATGSGARPDVFFNVYGEDAKKIAEFPGIRGDLQWAGPAHFVFTRIGDDIREGGSFANLAYGLRLSVAMFDAESGKEIVLKPATDTRNYSLASVAADGKSVTIIEDAVESETDWGDEDKIKQSIIEAEIPAASQAEASGAAEYKTYLNARFGYSIRYPDIFAGVREPLNGDGAEFSESSGEYGLVVWGGFNVMGEDGAELLKMARERVSHIVPDSEKSGEGFYSIVYGDDGGQDGKEHIFREYGVVNPEMKAGFTLKYPLGEAERFAETARVMEESLKLPDSGK